MGKLKRAICDKCQKPVNRHDPNRVQVKVGEGSNHRGIYRPEHLECNQSKGD